VSPSKRRQLAEIGLRNSTFLVFDKEAVIENPQSGTMVAYWW
jgi:hypothetical protein